MRLVTIQDKPAYDELCVTGVLRCKPELANWLSEKSFRRSYDWLVEQMKKRVGKPPQGVFYPIWAWYLLDGKPAKADLRRTEIVDCSGENYALTVELPETQVLLSDEENWHYVLNDWYFSGARNESDYDKANAWFDALPQNEKRKAKLKSWEKIFNITPLENGWHRNGYFVQATFWELRIEQVVDTRWFVGKPK